MPKWGICENHKLLFTFAAPRLLELSMIICLTDAVGRTQLLHTTVRKHAQ